MIRNIFTKRESGLTFDKIYQDYYRRVFNYAFSRILQWEEAEDATAEVFLVVLQNLQRMIRYGAASVQGLTGLPIMRWRITVARHTVAESFLSRQSSGKRKRYGNRNSPSTAGRIASCGNYPKRNGRFLALRYELDMTNAEIGELMGLTPTTVSQRYHRLLEKCRKLDGIHK